MTVSFSANKKFKEFIVSDSLLDEAIDWIAENLKPEDVFGESELETWALDNGLHYEEE